MEFVVSQVSSFHTRKDVYQVFKVHWAQKYWKVFLELDIFSGPLFCLWEIYIYIYIFILQYIYIIYIIYIYMIYVCVYIYNISVNKCTELTYNVACLMYICVLSRVFSGTDWNASWYDREKRYLINI